MDWTPDITVAAIVEQEGRFLCVEERINGRTVFNQPAGHVEHGDDAGVTELCERPGFAQKLVRIPGARAGGLDGDAAAQASVERFKDGAESALAERLFQAEAVAEGGGKVGREVGESGHVDPLPGNTLQLTIDAGLQQLAEDYFAGKVGSALIVFLWRRRR